MNKWITYLKSGQKVETLASSRMDAYKHVAAHYGADKVIDFIGSVILDIIFHTSLIEDEFDNPIIPELNGTELYFWGLLDEPIIIVEIYNLKYSKIDGNMIQLVLDEGATADIFLFDGVRKHIKSEMPS